MRVDFFDSAPMLNELFTAWWAVHYPDAQALDQRLLSRYGSIVSINGQPCALQYLYLIEDSEIAWLGFTTRHPKLKGYGAGKAIRLLFSCNEQAARHKGKTLVYTNFASPALHKAAQNMDYMGGVVSKEFIKDLGAR